MIVGTGDRSVSRLFRVSEQLEEKCVKLIFRNILL